jgi:hypothetical protein
LIFSLAGCGSTRTTSKSNEKFHLRDLGTIERKAPADRVYIALPLTPKDRPKDTTQTYHGKKGSKTDVTFDKDGNVTNILTDCPEINELEQKNLELDYSKREKDSERQFNIELAKIGQSTVLWLGGIFAVAWLLKGIVNKYI